MSHYMTAPAMRQTGLKPAAKIVLYWLADHHNGETGECFPSIARIADLCEMSRRAVEGHLADLERAGLIKRHARIKEGRGQTSNGYTLHMAETATQDLRTPSAKSAHPPAQNLRTINLGIDNLGNEQERGVSAKPKTRACSLPEEWVPSDRNIADAEARGFSQQEIDNEADRFKDYHLARGSTFKSWDAAWRTWLGNSRRYQGRQMAGGTYAGASGKGVSLASIVARRQSGLDL